MLPVEPGSFKMGSPLQSAVDPYEWPQHTVTLTRPFEVSSTEVTWAQYTRLMGANPSHYHDLCPACEVSHPIESVDWLDAVTFCNELSQDEGLTPAYDIVGNDATWDQSADGYRLLTEAEWEYTCRAGTQSDLANGSLTYTPSSCDYDERLTVIGWYCNNSGYQPHPVGELDNNPWGFYDMHGNVWEWVWDWSGTYDHVPVILGDFYYLDGYVESRGSLSVIQFLQDFGDGLLIRLTEVGSSFNIANLDIETSEVTFAYADFAGEVNLRINNDTRYDGVLTDFPSAIAPGVTMAVTAEQFIDAAFGEGVKGMITLTGLVTRVAIGGEILLLDDMNLVDSGTGQYDLDRLVNFNTMSLGYVYRPNVGSIPVPILVACAVTDPIGPTSGSIHMMRGGGYGNGARTCRSATRSLPDKGRYTGFRVARYTD
ncbi:formylglycine-generating enzyme family protein [bacterium]|nr:formylglycine-generating enzyme family protein [bacterium]